MSEFGNDTASVNSGVQSDPGSTLPPSGEAARAGDSLGHPADHSNDDAAAGTSQEDLQRREQEKARARENAAFAAMRQREREARDEANRERAQRETLLELLRQQRTPGNDQGPAQDAAPDPSKFAAGEFDPAFVRAVAKYEARQEARSAYASQMQALQEHQQRQHAESARAAAIENWEKSHALAQAKYPDFEVVVEAGAQAIPQHAKLLLASLDDGAELLYTIAKDPEQVKKLTAARNPVQVAVVLGELRAEARVAAKAAAEAATTEGAINAPATPGRGTGRSNSEPDPRNVDAYIAWRRKQIAGGRA